jgi:hypothetical protein
VTLRFWASRKKYQGLKFGSLVYDNYVVVNSDVRRFLLWVRDDNDKVKNIYQRYGMSYDKLHDEVWLNKEILNEKNN